MTHVALLELTNFYRFRSVRLALGPRAYAVEAELAGDAERSNFIGKSALAEAVPFALYGWHRAQDEPEKASGYEDRWIRGRPGDADVAKEGGVAVTLSNGVRIERTRRRGLSTQVAVTFPDGGGGAAGEQAQIRIDRVVGFAEADYLSLVFCRQKRCAQLVTERPGARMKLVADWLDFTKLDKAGEWLARKVGLAATDLDDLRVRTANVTARLADLEGEQHFGLALRGAALEEVERAGALAEEVARRDLMRAQEARELRAAWEVAEAGRARVRLLREQFAAAERALASLPPDGEAPDVVSPRVAAAQVNDRLRSARALARGEFNGRCPVREGFACPAVEELNRGVAEARAAEVKLDEEARAAGASNARSIQLGVAYQEARRERQRAEERVDLLRSQLAAEREPPARRAPPEMGQPQVEELRRAHSSAVSQLASLGRCAAEVRQLRAKLAAERAREPEVEARLAHLRAARLVVGRGGAQRRIAEAAVEQIARLANARLAAGGVDLRVKLRWRDEGAELAASCEACGASHPKSQAAKHCQRCGEVRGRVVHDRLTVLLSDRSGAAEDLAGLWLQRAAFEWLRERRSSAWRSMVLDEPFGALDPAHRRAVAAEVARMAREQEQLFVVAHQPGILESLPARILIRGDGAESTAEVQE